MNDELLTKIIEKTKEIFKYDYANSAINQEDTNIEAGYKVIYKDNVPSYELVKVVFSNKNMYICVTDSLVLYRNEVVGTWERKVYYDGWNEFLSL